jgi:hypothetical protein
MSQEIIMGDQEIPLLSYLVIDELQAAQDEQRAEVDLDTETEQHLTAEARARLLDKFVSRPSWGYSDNDLVEDCSK